MSDDPRTRLSQLPGWAQAYIFNLMGQRDAAVQSMRRTYETQTESEFYVMEYPILEVGGPKPFKRYVQAHTVTVEHAGVMLEVSTLDEKAVSVAHHLPDGKTGEVLFKAGQLPAFGVRM